MSETQCYFFLIFTFETRNFQYDLQIEQYAAAAATHFNEQVSHDLANFGMVSTTRSLRSPSSRASSRLRLHDTRIAAAKAALAAKETERKRKRSIEMEINQKQLGAIGDGEA